MAANDQCVNVRITAAFHLERHKGLLEKALEQTIEGIYALEETDGESRWRVSAAVGSPRILKSRGTVKVAIELPKTSDIPIGFGAQVVEAARKAFAEHYRHESVEIAAYVTGAFMTVQLQPCTWLANLSEKVNASVIVVT